MTKVMYGFPPDYWEMRLWSEVLSSDDIFLDVGANAGVYSLWAASLGARVVAFEPSVDSWDDLQTNINLNPWSIDTRMSAVGASVGEAAFTVGLDAMNHLVEAGFPSGASVTNVPMTTLDSEISDRVRGLKIDVEGYEGEVLRGAKQLLADRAIDVIQFEWNGLARALGASAPQILLDNGYRLHRVDATGLHAVQDPDPEPGTDLIATSPDFTVDWGAVT